MPFDDLKYTRRELAGELYEIQKHASNGSALANCKCIQEKHLIGVRTEAAEGVSIATDKAEKMFYGWLAAWSDHTLDNVLAVLDMNDEHKERAMWFDLSEDTREIRHSITDESWIIPNPASQRAYLPHGLTAEEKMNPALRKKLSECIKKVEVEQCPKDFKGYDECQVIPPAVCRASLSGMEFD